MATTDEQTEREKRPVRPRMALFDRRALNVPNCITLARLVLAGVLFAIISVGRDDWWIPATVLFVVAVSTDVLDGYIARKYGLVTVLGRILDPFVDKIIVCGAFIFLLEQNSAASDSGVTAWMVVIVIGREMFVTGLRGFLEKQDLDFSASFSGKLKMAVQCLAVTVSLLSLSSRIAPEPFNAIRDVILWTMVAVTAWSGFVYIWRAAVLLRPGDD